MSSAPLLSRPTRVVVGPQPGIEEGEELVLLGAIRELKTQHDRIDLEYVTYNPEIFRLLKGNWFLRHVHLQQPLSFPEVDYQLGFDDIVGNDFGLFVFEPDPQAAAIAEESKYKANFDAEVAQKTRIWESYQERGMKDIVNDLPVYNFQPQWHKSNGYLWSLADKLGVQVDVPFQAIAPYGELSSKVARAAQVAAAKAHFTDAPFAVFDFQNEETEIILAGVLGKALDPIKVFSLQALQKELGSGLTGILAVMMHRNCEYAVGPVGNFLYTAWAAGVPNILNLYTGNNWRWDGAAAHNTFPLAREQYDDERLPSAVYQGLMLLQERLKYGT